MSEVSEVKCDRMIVGWWVEGSGMCRRLFALGCMYTDLPRVCVEYAYSEWVSTGSMEVNVLCKGSCNRSQLVSIFDGNGYV